MENIQLSNILHIQEASKQGKLVMFVGAGVSANSGVPMLVCMKWATMSISSSRRNTRKCRNWDGTTFSPPTIKA